MDSHVNNPSVQASLDHTHKKLQLTPGKAHPRLWFPNYQGKRTVTVHVTQLDEGTVVTHHKSWILPSTTPGHTTGGMVLKYGSRNHQLAKAPAYSGPRRKPVCLQHTAQLLGQQKKAV